MVASTSTITRRFEFDAAHRVTRHGGKCRNLHGHRYAAEFTITGEYGEDGMVVDFSIIKEKIGGWVDDKMDHGAILVSTDEDLAMFCVKQGWKVYMMSAEPTAENIAEELYEHATRILLPYLGAEIISVRVWETPNCSAQYPPMQP